MSLADIKNLRSVKMVHVDELRSLEAGFAQMEKLAEERAALLRIAKQEKIELEEDIHRLRSEHATAVKLASAKSTELENIKSALAQQVAGDLPKCLLLTTFQFT